MATHHSKTSRAKSPDAQIVVPSWDKVWESFNAANQRTTIEAMNAEGWKTVEQASKESGISRCRLTYMANEGKFERVKRRVFIGEITRELNFIRPRV